MKMDKLLELINKSFLLNIGKVSIAPTYWQAGAIVFLLFLLVLSLARLRHMYVGWSLKGFFPQVLIGFFLAIILEGLLIIGGRTVFTELVGWDKAPKPISTALDEGRGRLVDVLGENVSTPSSELKIISADDILDNIQNLSDDEAQKVKRNICQP